MSRLSRRAAIATIAGAATPRIARCDNMQLNKPYGWFAETICNRRVYVRGDGRNAVVLLHEINGLSPGCVDFGVEIANHGYRVYMPLLFGHVLQDSFLGAVESCVFGGFKCTTAPQNENPKPVRWVSDFVAQLEKLETIETIGVIGMCQTGSYPLATMRRQSKVQAVVLSQPALPFGQDKQRDAGLTETTMQTAKASGIPILAFRFKEDTISTCDRFEYLANYFGEPQFYGEVLEGPPGFHQTLTHRLHAVLTGAFGEIRDGARRDVLEFFDTHLK